MKAAVVMKAMGASLALATTLAISHPAIAETTETSATVASAEADVDAGTGANQNHVLRVFFTKEGKLVIKGDVTPNQVNADPAQLASTLRQMAAPGAYLYLWGNNGKSYAEIEQVQHQIQLARKLIEPPKGEL
jgi:hypothetical protein